MTAAFSAYRRLKLELCEMRLRQDGEEHPHEEPLVEALVEAWGRLSPIERALIVAEGPQTLLRAAPPPHPKPSDVTVPAHPPDGAKATGVS